MNKQEMKFWARVFENVPNMSSGAMQGWIDNPEGLQQLLSGLASNPYLRHLKTVTLAATKGGVTLVKANWLDLDFENGGTDVSREGAAETKADVYEMIRAGSHSSLFGSLGDPRSLCLSWGQVEEFCRNHCDLLRQGGCGTLFLFEKMNGELFVASVYMFNGELDADVRSFSYSSVWSAEGCRRVVVKQQAV